MEITTNRLSITVSRAMQYSSVLMSMALVETGVDVQEVLRGGVQSSACSSVSTIIRGSDYRSEQRADEV